MHMGYGQFLTESFPSKAPQKIPELNKRGLEPNLPNLQVTFPEAAGGSCQPIFIQKIGPTFYYIQKVGPILYHKQKIGPIFCLYKKSEQGFVDKQRSFRFFV